MRNCGCRTSASRSADWIASAAPEASVEPADAAAHPFFDMHTHGFVRVATSTPKVRTADVAYNSAAILEEARNEADFYLSARRRTRETSLLIERVRADARFGLAAIG